MQRSFSENDVKYLNDQTSQVRNVLYRYSNTPEEVERRLEREICLVLVWYTTVMSMPIRNLLD